MRLGRILDWVSRLVTVRPWVTLAAFAVVTLILVAGSGFRAPVASNDSFLPSDSDVVRAMEEVEELFSANADVHPGFVVFRGEVLTNAGLAQMDGLLAQITSDPQISAVLPTGNPILAISPVVKQLLQTDDLGAVAQHEIDSAIDQIRGTPQLAGLLGRTVGIDTDGTTVGVATIQLREIDPDQLRAAQLRVGEISGASQGPLAVSTVTLASIEAEFQEATTDRVMPLFGLALLVIALLTFLFMRSFSDLATTLIGILVSLMWIFGVEGWLGPNALGLIGPPNALTSMVPIILIGLTVDYSIQAVSHYREQRIAGEAAVRAVRLGLRSVLVPLTLAALTTMVSLLTNLLSPVAAIGDFGVVAGLGVALSLVVMLTLVPAVRAIIDRRREARGKLAPPRPIATAIPGINRLAEALGKSVAHNATPYILAAILVTAGLGYSAMNLETDFGVRDLLPDDGQTITDLESIDAAVGGSSEIVNVLVKAEVTETRTLLNIFEMTAAFEDDLNRPRGAAGPLDASLSALITEHVTEGSPTYDPEIAAAFADATAGLRMDPGKIQQFLDLLTEKDPDGVRRVLVNDPMGVDTILLQFESNSVENAETEAMVEGVDKLWYGDDDAVRMTSPNIQTLAIAKEITFRQTEAIIITIIAALLILVVFFYVTDREPILAVIAVAPIALVLVWVLGTMALFGIPYSLITSIITALSIGIGVDYTIHVIHRYREEFTKSRNPEAAAIRTLATTGSALLGSALTTALGFGVLVLSPLRSFEQFGITAAMTIAYALIVATFLVPPAMTVWGAFRNMRLQSMVERMWDDLDVTIEETHRRHEGA